MSRVAFRISHKKTTPALKTDAVPIGHIQSRPKRENWAIRGDKN